MSRSFLSLSSLTREEFNALIDRAIAGKKNPSAWGRPLEGKSIALFFEKPSTRTRLSFEVAVYQLGGQPLVLTGQDLQISRGEDIADTARVMRRYLHGIMGRVRSHETLEALASYSGIPVINGLSDKFHPCQALADYMTLRENSVPAGSRFVFCGDGSSNMAHSLILGSAHYGCEIVIATPAELLPAADVLTIAARLGGKVSITQDAKAAAKDADVLYTDVWVSMGEEAQAYEKKKLLAPYQLNESLLAQAKKSVIVLHCLPAHKDEEITESVFESPNAKIFDQAENRLHAQKAVLEFLLK
ncbi:MAG: ornithine carbamoyltransferase [Leptospiraceae bacterium]|nr:ornithine carbamoyltransferase [Leptospiraceae bacterium]